MAANNVYSIAAINRMKELEGVPLASFPRRAIAFSVDFLIVSFVFALVTAVAALVHVLPKDPSLTIDFNLGNWYSLSLIVVYHAVLNRYWNGQTLGKRMVRIRVVSATHQHLSFWHAFERALGYGASTLELGFGFFQYFIADNRQTMHDRIGNTVVIAVPRHGKKEIADD